MTAENGPLLDMTPDGAFIEPPKPSFGQIALRLAMLAVALCFIAALFWAALLLLPLLILLAVLGYFGLRAGIFRAR